MYIIKSMNSEFKFYNQCYLWQKCEKLNKVKTRSCKNGCCFWTQKVYVLCLYKYVLSNKLLFLPGPTKGLVGLWTGKKIRDIWITLGNILLFVHRHHASWHRHYVPGIMHQVSHTLHHIYADLMQIQQIIQKIY